MQATTTQPFEEATDDQASSILIPDACPAPRRLDLRTDRFNDPMARPSASAERVRERAHHLRDGRSIMIIVILPFWLWVAWLPVALTLRTLSLVLRLLLATVRMTWRFARAVVSRKQLT